MQADTEQRKGRDSVWSAPFVILMAVNFFQSMAAFMANATLPVFADSLGATASMVGVVVSSFTLSALLVRPFAGPAFDSFSRKRLLLIAQGIICLSFFAYGFVDSLGVLIAIRLFHGVGIGCSGPLAMSLVSEYLPAAKFASGISIYALAQSFAQVIGPATGLYLVGAVGFSAAYFLAAALLVVAMGGILAIREPYRERLPYQLKLSRMFAREAVGKAAALMLIAVSFSCMGSYVVLYGYGRGVADNVGLFFVVYALCLVVTRPALGGLADRVGTPRVLVFGTICGAGVRCSALLRAGLARLSARRRHRLGGVRLLRAASSVHGARLGGHRPARGGQQHHVHGPRFGNACGAGGRGRGSRGSGACGRRHHGRLRARRRLVTDRARPGHAGHRSGDGACGGEPSAARRCARHGIALSWRADHLNGRRAVWRS